MCPNSCIAYTGPFESLEECPECSLSRYNTMLLESSKGRLKKDAQHFYTLPIGPQLQALWRTQEGAQKIQHCSIRTREILRIWNALDRMSFNSHLFFYLGTADGPGSVHFTGLVGHHGTFPCHMFCGIKGHHKSEVGHYYPVLIKPLDYQGCDHADVDVQTI
ncbi:hypothetical protein K439DRAFT_1333044 [Ramaria rubella]|nr:hypothetical protein K439DRAFT_1333044 [Ramaria rubella]